MKKTIAGFTMRRTRSNRNLVNAQGFTLIELLVVIGILGVLATVMAVLVNPQRQLAKARDTERKSDLYAILSSVYQYQAEHSGALPDTDGNPATSNFPTSLTCIGTDVSCFDLGSAGDSDAIVPVYMAQLPDDPKLGNPGNTQYFIYLDANNRLVASASGEVSGAITVTR